jgi:putative oxidoreductase
VTGVGLFLLRVITALALGWTGYKLFYDAAEDSARVLTLTHLVGTVFPLLGIMMIAGFATALSGILACALLLVSFAWLGLPTDGLSATAGGLSLVLILVGPGYYSVDARLFGWRRIEIERRGPKSES